MARDERIKSRAYTVRELEYNVRLKAEQDPNAPVQIGICVICGARIMTFERTSIVQCPKCTGETEVQPITITVKNEQ